MEDTYSKSRQQAEIAFGAVQSQFFARGHAVEELQSIATQRDDKTLRLREARFAKELADRAAQAIASPAEKRTKKR
jgi:hypothetical protein